MLVLSRKTGERIHIGDDVFVEVRRVAGNRVTLAIKAPREVRILRGELLETANETVNEFEVLDEPAAEESAKDTVIMKQAPTNPGIVIPAPHVAATGPVQRVHAK